jgi:hypothetical protein
VLDDFPLAWGEEDTPWHPNRRLPATLALFVRCLCPVLRASWTVQWDLSLFEI